MHVCLPVPRWRSETNALIAVLEYLRRDTGTMVCHPPASGPLSPFPGSPADREVSVALMMINMPETRILRKGSSLHSILLKPAKRWPNLLYAFFDMQHQLTL